MDSCSKKGLFLFLIPQLSPILVFYLGLKIIFVLVVLVVVVFFYKKNKLKEELFGVVFWILGCKPKGGYKYSPIMEFFVFVFFFIILSFSRFSRVLRFLLLIEYRYAWLIYISFLVCVVSGFRFFFLGFIVGGSCVGLSLLVRFFSCSREEFIIGLHVVK